MKTSKKNICIEGAELVQFELVKLCSFESTLGWSSPQSPWENSDPLTGFDKRLISILVNPCLWVSWFSIPKGKINQLRQVVEINTSFFDIMVY